MIFSCFARHEDMVRLEQEITDIHAVFMDLANMVSARGDELNRMEDHVNGAITSPFFLALSCVRWTFEHSI